MIYFNIFLIFKIIEIDFIFTSFDLVSGSNYALSISMAKSVILIILPVFKKFSLIWAALKAYSIIFFYGLILKLDYQYIFSLFNLINFKSIFVVVL